MSLWPIFFRMACVVLLSWIAVRKRFIKVSFSTLNVAARTIQLYINILSFVVLRIKCLTYFFSLKQLIFQLKVSALLFSNSFRYKIINLYNGSSSAHRTYFLFRTFIVINIIRFLWLLQTYIRCINPLQYILYYLKILIIANSSLL